MKSTVENHGFVMVEVTNGKGSLSEWLLSGRGRLRPPGSGGLLRSAGYIRRKI